jgi:hypothetical protein
VLHSAQLSLQGEQTGAAGWAHAAARGGEGRCPGRSQAAEVGEHGPSREGDKTTLLPLKRPLALPRPRRGWKPGGQARFGARCSSPSPLACSRGSAPLERLTRPNARQSRGHLGNWVTRRTGPVMRCDPRGRARRNTATRAELAFSLGSCLLGTPSNQQRWLAKVRLGGTCACGNCCLKREEIWRGRGELPAYPWRGKGQKGVEESKNGSVKNETPGLGENSTQEHQHRLFRGFFASCVLGNFPVIDEAELTTHAALGMDVDAPPFWCQNLISYLKFMIHTS